MKKQNKYAQLIEAQSPEPPGEEIPESGLNGSKQTRQDGSEFGEVGFSRNKIVSTNSSHDATTTATNSNDQMCDITDTKRNETGEQLNFMSAATGEHEQQAAIELQQVVVLGGSLAKKSLDSTRNIPTSTIDNKDHQLKDTQAIEISKHQATSQSSDSSSSQCQIAQNNGERESARSSIVSTVNSVSSNSSASTSAIADCSRRSSSITGSVSFSNNQTNYPSAEINFKTNGTSSNNHQQLGPRAIARSMLQFDKSHRMDKFEVVWNNLSFSYKQKWLNRLRKKSTQVLDNVSGRFKSNQLIAVIGPSGCGKTTLLQFLAGNNPSHKDKMRIVGLEEPKVAYIGQDDSLLPDLTARETLIYASRLQNNTPNYDHEQHIQPILNELGLTECANRSVTKISGGQAKRVTIAQELLYPTNLLILDEVTSGLDASTSYSIIKLLKNLVSNSDYPMSIVISIHQPSAKLFSVFDQVYVMAQGCCLYEGSCDTDLINTYLGRFNLKCPRFNNIADFLIEVATNNDISMDSSVREQMIQYQRKQSQLQDNTAYNFNLDSTMNKTVAPSAKEADMDCGHDKIEMESNYCHQNQDHSTTTTDVTRSDDEDEESQQMLMNSSLYDSIARARGKRSRPFYSHFIIHLERSFLRIRRSYILTWLQLITYILLGLQLATFYGTSIGTLSGCPRLPSNLISLVLMDGHTDEDLNHEMRRIQENMNFLLVAVMTATFAALEITVITFPLEAKTVKREWRNGWYRVSSYFMGRTIADLPFQLVFVVVFCVIVYLMTGQIGLFSWRFGSFVAIIVMIALVAQAVGFTFGAMFMDNLPAAVFTAPLCIFPALLFSGFFSRVSQIPAFYKPMTLFSHFRYAFDALLVTLYGFDRCECDQELLSSYHANMHNQTSTLRDMFKYLFGSSDCGPTTTPMPNAAENSIEDVTTVAEASNILNMLTSSTSSTTTISPLASILNSSLIGATATTKFKSIEDALVDTMFEHMSSNSTTTPIASDGTNFAGGTLDHIASKFSSRITTMFNKQSNYGHDVPKQCDKFNSYLMTEFDLHNEDLYYGLGALLIAVISTRLICNAILNFTIATRT